MTPLQMSDQPYDLLIKSLPGAKLYNSDSEDFVEAPDIAMADGKIAAMGKQIQWELARAVRWVQGDQIISPQIRDIHVHLAPSTFWGRDMDADRDCLAWGTGCAVDAGSTGWLNFPDFREHVIDDPHNRTKVGAFLNIAPAGLALRNGECKPENFRHVDVDRTVGTAKDHRDVIVGIKVRLGAPEAGNNWKEALKSAITAAEQIGKPVMVHIADGPPLEEILRMLRPGDIVTHCFHGKEPKNLVTILRDGKILDAVLRAQSRGVVFDVGHGGGSFDWSVATAAVASGFRPDTISSDLHCESKPRNAKNQLDVMTKILHTGIDLRQILAMVTKNAARAIGQPPETARIAVGSPADLAVIDVLKSEDSFPMRDGHVNVNEQTIRYNDQLLQKAFVVAGGVAL